MSPRDRLGPRATRPLMALGVAALCLMCSAGGAAAATGTVYTVSSFSDAASGSCSSANVCPSLRVAVDVADAHGPATVELGAGTYTLTLGELYVDSTDTADNGYALAITGAGAGQTVIQQQAAANRVIDFGGGGPYLVSDLEVTGGKVVSSDPSGAYGGGIYGGTSDIDLSGVSVEGNTATGSTGASGSSSQPGQQGGDALGGGFYDSGSAPVSITNSTFASNTATGGLGGAPGSGSTINEDAGAGGGGYGAGIAVTNAIISGSTFSDNTTQGGPGYSVLFGSPDTPGEGGQAAGAGIDIGDTSFFEVTNSTITGNQAIPGTGGSKVGANASDGPSQGAGIDAYVVGSLDLFSDTIAGNDAQGTSSDAGNIFTFGDSAAARWTVGDTIVADGNAGADGNCDLEYGVGGSIIDDGHNLESDTTTQCHFSGSSDLLGKEPGLTALAANGGPTETMLPQAGSPLIGAGGGCTYLDGQDVDPLTTDQRGEPRGGTCDIGAVQLQQAEPVGAPTIAGTPDVGDTVTCDTAGAFTGDELTYKYYWYRNGVKMLGFYNSTYVITAPDTGQQMTCIAIATGLIGATEAASSGDVVPPGAGAISFVKEKHFQVVKGKFKLTLACKGGHYGCRGAVSVFTPSLGKTFPDIGSTGYTVNSGKRKTLTFKVPKKVLSALNKHHERLSGELQFYLQDVPGPKYKISVTQPKPKKRRRR